jgi:hypothetical protein
MRACRPQAALQALETERAARGDVAARPTRDAALLLDRLRISTAGGSAPLADVCLASGVSVAGLAADRHSSLPPQGRVARA